MKHENPFMKGLSMTKLDPQCYPESYDNILSPEIQESVVTWFNYIQDLINFYDKQRHCGVKELELSAERFQKHDMNMIQGAKSLLGSIGVHIGYNMVGHRGKWTLVTYDTAVSQLDWEEQCIDYYD